MIYLHIHSMRWEMTGIHAMQLEAAFNKWPERGAMHVCWALETIQLYRESIGIRPIRPSEIKIVGLR